MLLALLLQAMQAHAILGCKGEFLYSVGVDTAGLILNTMVPGEVMDDAVRLVLETFVGNNGGFTRLGDLVDGINAGTAALTTNYGSPVVIDDIVERAVKAQIAKKVKVPTGNAFDEAAGAIGVGGCAKLKPNKGLVGGDVLPSCEWFGTPMSFAISMVPVPGSAVAGWLFKKLYCDFHDHVAAGHMPSSMINNLGLDEHGQMSGDRMDFQTIKDHAFEGIGDLYQAALPKGSKQLCWDMCRSNCACVAMSWIEPYWLRFDANTCYLKKGGLGDWSKVKHHKLSWIAMYGGGGELRLIKDRGASRSFKETMVFMRNEGTELEKKQWGCRGDKCAKLCEWTKPYEDRITEEGFFYVTSILSKKDDDAYTEAECPYGTVLSDCQCRDEDYNKGVGCDGARPYGFSNKCRAYSNGKGNGVYADAICVPDKCDGANIRGMGCFKWKDVESARNTKTAVATCPDDMTLTGCTCHSWWSGCTGSKKVGNTCEAYSNGRQVTAWARCGPKFSGRWTTVTGSQNSEYSIAECPEDTKVVGCSCRAADKWNKKQPCAGAVANIPGYVAERRCLAYGRPHGIVAEAICAETGLKFLDLPTTRRLEVKKEWTGLKSLNLPTTRLLEIKKD